MSIKMDISSGTDATGRVRPAVALVLHASPAHEVLVTQHQIGDAGTFGPGTLMDTDAVEELLALFAERPSPRRLLPENVLMSRPSETLWYCPSKVCSMWFRQGDKVRRYQVPWPALLFHAAHGMLRIAALADDARPRADTPLYHAPLMNIYGDGQLCLGNIKAPHCDLDGMAGWEQAVYDTHFTHVNHERAMQPPHHTNAGHLKLWRRLAREKAQRFPIEVLVPMDCTLEGWL